MPPIMIATKKYKKKPEGTEITVSASSAKAMSALGLADYKTTDSPPVINREMQAESTNTFADRVYGQSYEPSAEAAASVDGLVDAEVTHEVAGQEYTADAVIESETDSTNQESNTDSEETAEQNATEESVNVPSSATPVVGSINAKTEDTKIQQNKKSNHKSKK